MSNHTPATHRIVAWQSVERQSRENQESVPLSDVKVLSVKNTDLATETRLSVDSLMFALIIFFLLKNRLRGGFRLNPTAFDIPNGQFILFVGYRKSPQ